MGNYHPALKQLFHEDEEPKWKPKRERGLAMGVGSFVGGVLRIGGRELAAVSRHDLASERSRGRGRGRGSRGRGSRGR